MTSPKVTELYISFFVFALIPFPSLHFLTDRLAQQPRGPEQQHDDQHGKDDGIPQLGGDIGLSQNLNHTQQNHAPGMEPIPPKTAAVKALIPGMEPVVGIRVG